MQSHGSQKQINQEVTSFYNLPLTLCPAGELIQLNCLIGGMACKK